MITHYSTQRKPSPPSPSLHHLFYLDNSHTCMSWILPSPELTYHTFQRWSLCILLKWTLPPPHSQSGFPLPSFMLWSQQDPHTQQGHRISSVWNPKALRCRGLWCSRNMYCLLSTGHLTWFTLGYISYKAVLTPWPSPTHLGPKLYYCFRCPWGPDPMAHHALYTKHELFSSVWSP